ncbi:hypothetical protein TNCV_2919481 [Trichonephila clavipes]|nr:hypothetical protein TNCV_2919481 [Trichonephila clavipes]
MKGHTQRLSVKNCENRFQTSTIGSHYRQRGSAVPDQPCTVRAHQEAVETINGKRTPQHVKRTQNERLIRTHAGAHRQALF